MPGLPSARPSAPAPTPAAISCPAAYLPPDPNRPRITQTFELASDHPTVTGSEQVVFTPDRPVTELVYRLWPNGPDHRLGGSLTVTSAQVESRPVALQLSAAGGRPGTQGTLLSLPLGRTAAAGQPVTSTLTFTLKLPPPFVDRVGSDGHTAWWGTGAPLLAWVRGSGWVRTPGSSTLAEVAVSEAAQTDVFVTAPAADTVLANGKPSPPVAVSSGRRRWHFFSSTARDVVVAAGRFTVRSESVATPAGPVTVTVGAAPDLLVTNTEALQHVKRILASEVQRFGPYPFEQLTAAVIPGIGSTGVEYPGMYLVGDSGDQEIPTHEVAHMWFYGLVGDDQELHPWLDEAFATAAEVITDAQLYGGPPEVADPTALSDPRPVDSPVTAFEHDQSGYDTVVYFKGAAALLEAREQAGEAKFDAALRCYLNAHAWQVADPKAVGIAFRQLPKALTVLRKAGAL